MSSSVVEISISPRRVGLLLAAAIALLLAAHSAGQIAKFAFGDDHVFGLVPAFYFDREGNVPTWFSAAMLLLCALALLSIGTLTAQRGRQYARHWQSLAVVFAYLSLDEAAAIHEHIGPLFRTPLNRLSDRLGGLSTTLAELPTFAWTLPAIAIIVAASPWYVGFFKSLPRVTRVRFGFAAICLVTGGIGVELLGAQYISIVGARDGGYAVLVTIEELLEMIAVATFLLALLTYIDLQFGPVTIRIG
jgi:hypothetical protein